MITLSDYEAGVFARLLIHTMLTKNLTNFNYNKLIDVLFRLRECGYYSCGIDYSQFQKVEIEDDE